jgi:hypothetical protein
MKTRLSPLRAFLAAISGMLVLSLCPPQGLAQGKKKAPAAKEIAKPEAAKSAAGDQQKANAGDADGDQTKVKVERGARGKKVYRIEGEIVIEGKIQKPEAFYVLQKSSINYDWHELKQEFVPKILESVTKAPF